MSRDGLEVAFMPNGIHITVKDSQKHGHTLLWDDLDEMRKYSDDLQVRS
jgi:hypothetical protein